MDTVIIWHICDILWKFQPSSSIFRLWHLEAKILKWPENGQNPKGGPLDEKNIFSTTFLDLVENRLKWLEMLCWFQKHVDQYIFDIWCHQMTSAVIRCHVMSYDDIQCHKVHWYICFWNQHRVSDRLSLIWIKSENVVEKIFFSSKGPPFGFWPLSGHFKCFVPHEIQVPQPKNRPRELKISGSSCFYAKIVWFHLGKDQKKNWLSPYPTISSKPIELSNMFLHFQNVKNKELHIQ